MGSNSKVKVKTRLRYIGDEEFINTDYLKALVERWREMEQEDWMSEYQWKRDRSAGVSDCADELERLIGGEG